MKRIAAVLIAANALSVSFACSAAPVRSAAEILAFKRSTPCPSTGQRRGACPGHQVDHITPLCAGGQDNHTNMQWLTIEAHREKTRDDVRACRILRRHPNP